MAPPSSPVGLLEQATTVDVIELAPEGLRIRYSPETALWLAGGGAARPLRSSAPDRASERAPPSAASAPLPGALPSDVRGARPRLTAARAARAKLGCARLHRLVLDVLPPLQHAAARVAREAIQTVVFEGEGGTARALYAAQLADDDAALATRQAALRELQPRQLGLPPQFWLDDGDADGSDDDTRAAIRASTLALTRRRSPAQTLPELLCHATSSSSFATRAQRHRSASSATTECRAHRRRPASRCYWAPTIWCR